MSSKSTKISFIIKLICISLYFSQLLACASLNNVLEVDNVNNELKIISYSDDLQNTFVKKGKHGTKICSQPDPDAAEAYADGVTVALGSQGDGAQDSANATSLGGRNPEVLIARELLYRACELGLNYDVSYDEARSIYTEFLGAIKELGKSQTGNGSASVAGSVTNIQNKAASSDDDEDEESSSSSSSSSSK
jgi:hypothetical protein